MHLILTRVSVVTIFLQLAIFYSVDAQVKPARMAENVGKSSQKFTLGFRVGPSITVGHFPKNLPDTVLKAHSNKPKFGFSLAGQLNFPMKNDYWCLIELGYSRGGRKVEYNDHTWQNDFTYNFISSSLALRRAFKVQLKEGLIADWYLSVGPNISYMINGKGVIRVKEFPTDGSKPYFTDRSPFTLQFHNLSDSAWYDKAYNDIGIYHFNKANRFFFGVDLGLGFYAPITKRQKLHGEFRVTLGQTFLKKRDTKATLGGVIGGVTDPANPIPPPQGNGFFSDPLTTNMKTFTLSAIYTLDFDKKAMKQGKSTQDKKRKSSTRRRR